jgi:hypothetical protein
MEMGIGANTITDLQMPARRFNMSERKDSQSIFQEFCGFEEQSSGVKPHPRYSHLVRARQMLGFSLDRAFISRLTGVESSRAISRSVNNLCFSAHSWQARWSERACGGNS